MRRTILIIASLGLAWIGYIAWPVYDLLVLIRAVETRDIDTVTRRINFDRVRISLADQIVRAYMRRTGIQPSPLARTMAIGAVHRLMSPEALSQLITAGWPGTIVPDKPPPDTLGITTDTIGTIWQIFENAEYGFGRFDVGRAGRVATAATFASRLPTLAVALATRRDYPPRKYSELARG